MYHKDSDLKSVLEVRFYFSTCVLESEFVKHIQDDRFGPSGSPKSGTGGP